ncbi:helix-turn-helix transcriptional regulator [Sporosarcina sp. resist]|uniref:helix-turn-helix domain-containing protein n=1 Tax=Sporosarcina sp. resist TaxID=2762563 RepID=UPI00164CE537|nr:helix-turn-helix transcriptional regulator [Sporosarcina sp. resist]QNK87792.1 helix-turn-helix transcriptional regulator [Sporosarcina sp. resist]
MLGKRLAELRNMKGISQYELADRLGFSRGKLANYEQGSRQPDYETLKLIANYFGVTTDYLLDNSDIAEPTKTVTVAGQEINLSIEELMVFNELKKHPIMFHDLATDPEAKVKELIKLYKMKKMFLEDDTTEHGDGFGELED